MSSLAEFTPVESSNRRVTRRARRARWRAVWAVLASTLLHVVGVAVVLWMVFWAAFAKDGGAEERIAAEVGELDDTDGLLVSRRPARDAQQAEEVRLDADAAPETLPRGSLPEPDESFDWQAFAQANFGQALRANGSRTAAEQESRLDRYEWMLGHVSNEGNVGEMAASLSGWLGANARKPAAVDRSEPIEDDPDFDAGTAQVLEVLVEPTDAGGNVYVLLMADAEGRLQRVPTDEASGRKLKRILDRIAGNPLLETLYRDVVMGLLDKMVAE